MNILVTGATGFIGRHLVSNLTKNNNVVAISRNTSSARGFEWDGKVKLIECDIYKELVSPQKTFGPADIVIHLAWSGLPNYTDLFHFEDNMPSDYRFLKSLVLAGYDNIVVSGTCFEYGMQSGSLSENIDTKPANPYGLAKDTLHKCLQELQKTTPFILKWIRLFYMYGKGQNKNSIIAQLDRAIDEKQEFFNMSGGEQLRDYISVTDLVDQIAKLIEFKSCSGVYNCCSGAPISVRNLVEARLDQRGADIRLNLGYYPYPDFEPMAFWGDRTKLDNLLLSQ